MWGSDSKDKGTGRRRALTVAGRCRSKRLLYTHSLYLRTALGGGNHHYPTGQMGRVGRRQLNEVPEDAWLDCGCGRPVEQGRPAQGSALASGPVASAV